MAKKTIARYAIISDGVVVNVTMWDGDTDAWSPPEGMQTAKCTAKAGIGWTYADGKFLAPAAPDQEEAPAAEETEG